jgi:WD40 repeat protein
MSGRHRHRRAITFRREKIKMMSNRRDRVLHLKVETGEMYGVFSPDRSRLLTGGDGVSSKVQIWDVETGNCFRALNGHKEPVAALAWAEDQRSVASGAFDRCVRIWDVASGDCLRVLAGHRSYVRSAYFSQSGERLLSGSGDGVVRLWGWRPRRCCKNSRVIVTGFIMLFSTEARLESCREAAIVRSGCGKSTRDVACD